MKKYRTASYANGGVGPKKKTAAAGAMKTREQEIEEGKMVAKRKAEDLKTNHHTTDKHMCLYQTKRENPKYRANKKNGGIIPRLQYQQTAWVMTDCGLCIECRKKKAREWQVRLMEDIKTNKNAIFVTLTMSNEGYTYIDEMIKADYRGYGKFRYHQQKKEKDSKKAQIQIKVKEIKLKPTLS